MTITDDLVKAIDALVTHRVNIIINEDNEWFDELLDRKIKMKSDPTDQVHILINALETIASMDKTDEVPDSIKADYPEQSAEELEETWAEYVSEYTYDNHDWLVETAQDALAKYNGNEEQ